MGLVLQGEKIKQPWASTQRPPLHHSDDRGVSPWEMASLWCIIKHVLRKQSELQAPGVPLSLLSHSQLGQWINRSIDGFLGEGGCRGKQAEGNQRRKLASGCTPAGWAQVRIADVFFFVVMRTHFSFLLRFSL